jgi:pimeloyl-ACP methyl ester carboxylesterase
MAILPVALCPPVDVCSLGEGLLGQDMWTLPPAIPFFVRPKVRWIPEAQTQVYAAYDAKGLIVSFRCFEDAPERLEAAAGPPEAGLLLHDDYVGFRLGIKAADGKLAARHFVITAGGGAYEETAPGRFEQLNAAPCSVTVGLGEWTAEVRLDFASLGIDPPKPGRQWGFSAHRQRVGARLERSSWIEVGPGPFGETLTGWLQFESAEESEGRRRRAKEPYLLRFGASLDVRVRQAKEAEASLKPEQCPVTRFRIHLMIRSFSSVKNDMPHSYHPDAMRHYAQILQYNLGRMDELIETLRLGEDPHTSPDGYVFHGARSETDGANHAFAVMLGRGYQSTNPHPAIVFLHGLTDDWIADSRSFMPLAWPPELDFVMAFPSGLGMRRTYRLAAEDEVFAVIGQIQKRFNIDHERISLVGMGLGAGAAYHLAARFPHLFSAVACAGPIVKWARPLPRPFFRWAGPEKGWAGPLDDISPAENEALNKSPIGGPGILTPDFVARLTSIRSTVPRRIEILAPNLRYGRNAWARIDRLADYSRFGRLELESVPTGKIVARAENVRSFSILPQHGPFAKGQSLSVEIDGKEAARGVSSPDLLRVDLAPVPQEKTTKNHEVHGPIDDAFHGPLLYVYGTAGGQKDTELFRRAAYQAARWPQHDLRIPVKADIEVTDADIQGKHLHLFGGPAWNKVAARMTFRFPLKVRETSFSVGAETFDEPGYVCQFIYPSALAPDRYVLMHLANSEEGWLYRGWFAKPGQPPPMPDLWVARVEDNPRIAWFAVEPNYLKRLWFDECWRLPEN